MNIAVFVDSLEYISKNYTLLITLTRWLYDSLSELHSADCKLLRSIKKQDYEVTNSIVRYVIRLNLLTEQAIYSFCFIGDPFFRIKLLIDYGVDRDVYTFGNFLMSKAAELGYIDIVRLLLDFGVDPNITYLEFNYAYREMALLMTNEHVNALSYACSNQHLDIVNLLLHEPKVSVETKSEALCHVAMDNDNISLAKLLLENGADVNCEEANAVIIACEFDSDDMAKLLIDSGFDIASYGEYALYIASFSDRQEVVQYLLDKGVIPVYTDENQYNRHHFTDDIVKLLSEANPHLFD